ncbi:MAG: DDE-type integrase/transposase/recombinase, partial [Anaplasma sp.]|nr:DDE-type integrase/transposase/recombinase [Anaplasma sp.]
NWERHSTAWETIHIDFAGPVQGKIFLVVVDAYTKWLEVRVVSRMSSSAIIKELRALFATFKISREVCSDNGAALISEEIMMFYRMNNIIAVITHPTTRQSTGRRSGWCKSSSKL